MPAASLRIGIYRQGGLGDVFLLMPTLRAIRCAYPDAWIHVWGSADAAYVLQYLGLCDSSDQDRGGLRLPPRLTTLLVWTWPDQHHGMRLLASAHGIPTVMTEHAWAPPGVHQARYLFACAQRVLDLPAGSYSEEPVPLPPYRAPDPGGQILLHMGSSVTNKLWPRERFEELAGRLRGTHGLTVEQLHALPGHDPLPGVPFLRRPLLGVLWLLAGCRCLIAPDTGVAHLAGIIGAPAVALFGPAQMKQWAPVGGSVTSLQTCSRMLATDDTPFCQHHACFAEMSVELVEEAVLKRLGVYASDALPVVRS